MAKKIVSIFFTVILVLLIAVVIVLFVVRASGNSPSIFGYHVFRVSSGSMVPTIMKDDVILVKDTPAEEIHKDDIVTYKAREGEMKGQMITHRVVAVPEVKDGTYYFQTRGDVKGAALDPIITYDQIEGKYISKIPLLDKIYSFFFTTHGLIIFIFVIIALFGYEIISMIISYRSLDLEDDNNSEQEQKKRKR